MVSVQEFYDNMNFLSHVKQVARPKTMGVLDSTYNKNILKS